MVTTRRDFVNTTLAILYPRRHEESVAEVTDETSAGGGPPVPPFDSATDDASCAGRAAGTRSISPQRASRRRSPAMISFIGCQQTREVK